MIDKRLTPYLVANGKSFTGWTNVTINRSMRQVCGSFSLDYAPQETRSSSQIREQDSCKVLLGTNVVITGFVESLQRQISEGEYQPSINGREKLCDLVDCCYTGSRKQWINYKLEAIVRDLCAEFGIEVVVDGVDTGARIKKYTHQPGMRVIDEVMELCSYRAVLPLSNGDGKLYLTTVKARKCNDKLFFGKAKNRNSVQNVSSSGFKKDMSNRFSEYTVMSQVQTESEASLFDPAVAKPENPVSVKATVTDTAVTRHRPLVIVAEEGLSLAECRRRALWEKSVRLGASNEYPCTVNSWTQSNGDPWDINWQVLVEDTENGIHTWMTIADLTNTLDESGGEVCSMVLVPPAALKQLAVAEPVDEPETEGVSFLESVA